MTVSLLWTMAPLPHPAAQDTPTEEPLGSLLAQPRPALPNREVASCCAYGDGQL